MDLQQGDLLSKQGLTEILRVVHPHYLGEEYTHFLVLTQTCDLVRRGENCKTRYVSLAAVRPAEIVLQREIQKYQDDFAKKGMLCSRNKRFLLEQLLARLLNNNEPEYFFLRREDALNLHDDSCAFLRLSVSIRAYQHYDACLAARVVSLTEPFQAKLGWLIGNMFSRIGTEDWVPEHVSDSQFTQMIAERLDQLCVWVDDAKLRIAKSTANPALLKSDLGAIRKHVDSTIVPSRREQVLERIQAIVTEAGLTADAKMLQRLRTRLVNDPEFSRAVK